MVTVKRRLEKSQKSCSRQTKRHHRQGQTQMCIANEVERLIKERRVLGCTYGNGSMLSIALADRNSDIEVACIFVQLCDWILIHGDIILVDSDFDPHAKYSAFDDLVGQEIVSIYVFPELDELHLDFSGGFALCMYSAETTYGRGEDIVSVLPGDGNLIYTLVDGAGWVPEPRVASV